MTTNTTIQKLQKENELLKKQIEEIKTGIKGHPKYKETVSALSESEERFKQLSNLAYEGIIIHDNGIAIDTNLAIEKISGYSRKEIIGNSIIDLFVPEKYKALVYEQIIKNLTIPYKIEAKHKNGYFIPIEIESRNITIGNKKTRVTAIRDLSEKIKTMKELEDSREKYKKTSDLFRLLADTTPDMIWAKDMDGNFTFVNKAICKDLINAKDTEEPIGKHVMFFANRERDTHSDNKEWFTFGEECGDSDAITIKNGKPSRFIEYGNVFGKNLILDVYKAPLLNDKSEMIGTVGSARDITKQKEADEKLKLSEERYRMLFENAPDPIVIHNGKTILDVNIATVKSLEKSKNELIGKDLPSFIHPDDLAISRQRMKEMLNNFKPLESIELRIITPSGKEITTIATPTPIYFNGNATFMVTYHDITNRKKAEEAIANKEQQFKAVIESAYDAIYLVDYYSTQIILANQQAANQTGFTANELLTLTIADINPAFNDDRFRNDLRLKIINETLVTVEMANKHKKGYSFPAEVRISMINYNGRKTLLAFVRDITERKNAEKALMESEERFKKLSDITFEGILIHEKGVAIDMNNALPNMFGYKKEELMGKNLIQLLVSKKYHPIIGEHMKEEYAHCYRVIGIRKDGTHFPLELEAKSIKYKNKTTLRVAAFRDISYRVKNERDLQKAYEELYEQKEKLEELNDKLKKNVEQTNKINKELEISKKRAEESDRLKSAFLANMSHEIRTPMNGILGFTSLLKNLNISPQERLTYLDIIDKSGNRLINIINNLIDISKIESGQMTVSKADCNITKEMKELYAFFKLECRQKRLELIYSNNFSDEPLIVNTDQDKFTAIVTNLIKNAIKYTKEGSIEFGFNIKHDNIEFFVKDTGIGIPEKRHKAIFERFIQADIEDRQAYEGAGLGLAISMAYVKMLGGELRVDSFEGKGSTFYFTIPYTAPTKKEPFEESKKPVTSSHNKIPKLNILIAEDELFADELLTIIVKKFVGNLYHAKTGEEAITIFKKHPNIDLILMDIKMQHTNGYQASKEIRKLSDKVIIIAQTANALVGDREKAMESGCNDYIAKPIIKNDLLKKISDFF